MNRKPVIVFTVAAVLLVALLAAINIEPSAAAPMPAPTPVSASPRGVESSKVNFFAGDTMTADTTSSCVDVSTFEIADIYYSVDIDASNVNTTTVYLQHGNSPAELVNGIAVASAVAADVTALNQFQVFGAYLCLKVDVATTDTITVTANALLK